MLGAYVLDQLSADDHGTVRTHLHRCPDCRDEVAEIEPIAQSLRLADPDRMIESEPPGYHPRRIARFAVIAAAAALVGAGIGYAVAPSPPQLPLEPVAVNVLEPSVESSADVVPHTWGIEIKLTGSGFADGTSYRVLVRARDGREVNAGEFIGTGATTIRCNLNSSVLRTDALGFRVVDAEGREVLTSSMI